MNDESKAANIVDRICIAMPCNIGWENMTGDDEVRLCSGCDKNVYNISAMSKRRAKEVLSQPQLPCISLTRDRYGNLVTDECPRLLKPMRNGWRKIYAFAISMFAFFTSALPAFADQESANKPKVSKSVNNRSQWLVTDGVPIDVRRYQDEKTEYVWPGRIYYIGYDEEDIVVKPKPSFADDEIGSPQNFKSPTEPAPTYLDVRALETFFKARHEHLKACMYWQNKRWRQAFNCSKETQKLYETAIDQIKTGKRDAGFETFVNLELGKMKSLQNFATQALNDKIPLTHKLTPAGGFQVEGQPIDPRHYRSKNPEIQRKNEAIYQWPSDLTRLGIQDNDLPSINRENVDELAGYTPADVILGNVDFTKGKVHLDTKSWALVEQARELHAKACLLYLKAQFKESLDAAHGAKDAYAKAQSQILAATFDPNFREYVEIERNRIESLIHMIKQQESTGK